jgi:hypothetical protein
MFCNSDPTLVAARSYALICVASVEGIQKILKLVFT